MAGDGAATEGCEFCGGKRHNSIARVGGGLVVIEGRSDDALLGLPAKERLDRRTGNDTLEISMANDLRWVGGVTTQIAEFCAVCNLPPGIAFALNQAVDELLSGTIIYGYDDDETHGIEIIVQLERDCLVVVLADDARPYDAWPAPEPEDGALHEAAMSAGASRLFFARKVVEGVGVRYRRTDGCNVVTLTKQARLGQQP